MNFENITLEFQGPLATVTFNRPKVLNALNEATMRELGHAIETIGLRHEVRGLILTGAGDKAFIAGADIKEFSTLTPVAARDLSHLGQRVTRAMESLPIPVVAAVNGYCLGGGFEVALSCDFILASDNAKLGLPEVTLGIIPGWGGTQRLARLIGPNRSRQLVYTGQKLSATEARDWGIVNAVYPQAELIAKSRELLEQIFQNAPLAIGQAKRCLYEGLQGDVDRGLLLEQTSFGLCFTTEDLREGVSAFEQRRKANFKGK